MGYGNCSGSFRTLSNIADMSAQEEEDTREKEERAMKVIRERHGQLGRMSTHEAQVSCDWWRPGHVTSCSPLIGPGAAPLHPPDPALVLQVPALHAGLGRHVRDGDGAGGAGHGQ